MTTLKSNDTLKFPRVVESDGVVQVKSAGLVKFSVAHS